MSYDYRDGRLLARVVEATADNGESRWTYDAAGRITTQTVTAGGTTTTTTFTYDGDGRLHSHTSGADTWTYAYDAAGRVSRITTGDWTQDYTYRADGRLDHFELIDAHGSGPSRIDDTYDARGRLIEDTLSGGPGGHRDTIRHVYDCDTARAQ
jgi:YD repeat-containing protein